MSRFVRRASTLVIALIVAAFCASPAAAHPLGNFTINHLAKVRPGPSELTVKYVLDIAEIPTFQIMRGRGIEGAQRNALLARWANDEIAAVNRGLQVTVDGQPVQLHAGAAQATTRPGAGGLPILYWGDEFHAALPAAVAPRRIALTDTVYQGRIGWKDIVIVPDTEP